MRSIVPLVIARSLIPRGDEAISKVLPRSEIAALCIRSARNDK